MNIKLFGANVLHIFSKKPVIFKWMYWFEMKLTLKPFFVPGVREVNALCIVIERLFNIWTIFKCQSGQVLVNWYAVEFKVTA